MAAYKGIKAVLRQFYVLIKQKLDDLSNTLSKKITDIENNITNIKVDADHFEGTLPISKGGTGATDAATAFNTLANAARDSATPVDTEKMLLKPTGTWYKTTCLDFWNYIKNKISSVLGLTVNTYNGRAATAANRADYRIDLSSLSSSNFYPVIFQEDASFSDVAVRSDGGMGSDAYNQNRIHFLASYHGGSDTPESLNILEYACYDAGEITIGCIGYGQREGGWAIWLRGGEGYWFSCLNATPTLRTSDYTIGSEKFTVGTNYYGGSNVNVAIGFTPQSTITSGSYIDRLLRVGKTIRASRFQADNVMNIPTSVPSSPQNGDIWIE